MKKIDNAAAFLWNTGLLGEINRQVLHPRGLMLSVVIGGQEVRFGELSQTDDPEGIEFGPEGVASIAAKLDAAGLRHPLPARAAAVGFEVEPLPPPAGCATCANREGEACTVQGPPVPLPSNGGFDCPLEVPHA